MLLTLGYSMWISELRRDWASQSIITGRAVLRRYGALARLTLPGNNGRIRRNDESRQGFLRFLDLGG